MILRLFILFICYSLSPIAGFAQWTNTSNIVQLNTSNRNFPVSISDNEQILAFGKLSVLDQPDDFGNDNLVYFAADNAMKSSETILRLQGSANPSASPRFIRGIDSNTSSTHFEIFTNGDANFRGRLNLHSTGLTGTILRAQGDEAIWYNGTVYSWGFDGTYNRFARPMTIGSGTQPGSFVGLRVDQNQGINIAGNGDFVFSGDIENSILFNNTNSNNRSEIKSTQSFLSIRDQSQLNMRVGFTDVIEVFETKVDINTDLNLNSSDRLSWFEGNDNWGFIFTDPDRMRMAHSDDGQVHISGGSMLLATDSGGAIWIENGGVGIGSDNPQHALHVQGDVGITGEFLVLSDGRNKEDVSAIEEVLSNFILLNPVDYFYKDKVQSEKSIGLIAQEVEQLFPHLVQTSHDGTKMVNYRGVSVLAIKAIKEQQELILAQEEALAKLMDRVKQLELK